MNILAIETATEACSCALLSGGTVIERYRLAPREHNNLVLPMVAEVLVEAGLVLPQLDAIAFGCGPGSFTGVRIATGVVQGLALGLDVPVVPVSTLAALALEAFDTVATVDVAAACIDARMGEVYWGVYRRQRGGDDVELLGVEAVLSPDAVELPATGPVVATGSGWMTYGERLRRVVQDVTAVLPDRFPRAAAVARLAAVRHAAGLSLPPEAAQPVYLRDKVAKTVAEREGRQV